MRACFYGSTSCAREMVKDSRVKVNEPKNDGRTPLWWAAWSGFLDIIKWWIVSGREMDLGKPGDVDKTDVIGAGLFLGWIAANQRHYDHHTCSQVLQHRKTTTT